MIDPSIADSPDADRAAYIRAVIQARCGDVLTDADLATLTQAATTPAELLPVEIGEQIIDAITALEDKLDWLAEAVGVNRDEDDDGAARRRAG
jgi:hypothetical protein